MSLVGKKIIPVPAGVEISIDGDRNVTVKGAKGTLTMQHRPEVFVVHDGDEKAVRVTIDEKRKGESQIRAYWGLTRSLIANMIVGVTQGYEKKLDIVGVGWQAQLKGQNITISGPDKQAVGNFASSVRMQRKPEPYNGKGIRYAGEQITRKQGKAFGN